MNKLKAEKVIPTFVGLGFGPIQIGLFLLEAYRSGHFDRLVVSEINQDLVAAVRRASGNIRLNVADRDGLRLERIEGVEIYHPDVPDDREKLIAAISQASAIATALPSVQAYAKDCSGSPHRLLAQGFMRKNTLDLPDCIVYTAENNTHAAQILQSAVAHQALAGAVFKPEKVGFVNTVIGKMSQVIYGDAPSKLGKLTSITPDYPAAVLVEAFNTILISKFQSGFRYVSGFPAFIEKTDLAPFEEAKLYGHNAIHFILGSLGCVLGIESVPHLSRIPEVMAFVRSAFVEEVGTALRKKYSDADDLFSTTGFRHYVDDLIARMTNPYLNDQTERLVRDIPRKLGWNDRLIGAIRLCQAQGVVPERLGFGAACGLFLFSSRTGSAPIACLQTLAREWLGVSDSLEEIELVTGRVEEGLEAFSDWEEGGFSYAFLQKFLTQAEE